jgi:SAM-dependent methyltransferase
MKIGYEELLRKYGFKGNGIGSVLSKGMIEERLSLSGYYIEPFAQGNSFDYIVIGKSMANLKMVKIALAKLKNGGILVLYTDGNWTTLMKKEYR